MAGAGEDELIQRFFAPLAGPGSLGLHDDAALVSPPAGQDLVVTADALVAGVHFFPDDPPGSIGRKALGVNLSDLAAKGADPLGFLLTLALPEGWTEEWLQRFCDGLGRMAGEHGCPLLGGDTVRAAGPLTLSITALGSVPAGRMVRRTTANAGETICVTGTIGDAYLGLALSRPDRPDWAAGLDGNDAAFLVDRYRHPQPRTALAHILSEHASAAMDVSDGFGGDLAKMLRVSGVGGRVDLERVPISVAGGAAVGVEPALRDRLISGGDDYEILCTVPVDRLRSFTDAASGAGVRITCVGITTVELGLVFRRDDMSVPLAPASFSHF